MGIGDGFQEGGLELGFDIENLEHGGRVSGSSSGRGKG